MRLRYWIVIGVVAVGGAVILASDHHQVPVKASVPARHHVIPRRPKPKPKAKVPTPSSRPIPKKAPSLPTSGSASGSADASFITVTGEAPPVPLQLVSLPWAPTTQWAVEPLGLKMNHNALRTLWFGEKTGNAAWHWIPTTLPGVPSSTLPAPIQQSLNMAYSLHLGEPGPANTVGNITWSALQNEVSAPVGWTLTTVSATNSPLFQPTVAVTVFARSLTGNYTGYYGLEAALDSQNAKNGIHGLVGFVSRPGPLATIVASPPALL